MLASSSGLDLQRARLGQQLSCDCRSAYTEDKKHEHKGEQAIWFEPVDGCKQGSSYQADCEHIKVRPLLIF
jgi:hypothetical protein